MLHLYQSNRLETLATLLHEGVLANPPSQTYARDTVIVQARGMGRWLSLQIAQRFGVCANVDFPLPATFLWRLIESVLGPQPSTGPFSADAMAWRLYDLLATPPAALVGYLQDGQPRRRWRLASRIADVFDQYLVYRPDWLQSWERGERVGLGADEDWQMALWQALATGRDSPHRADLMQKLINRLQDTAPLALPERIVLFGISSLPPLLLAVLQALAVRTDVALFALNPCAAPWGDVTRNIDPRVAGERLLAAWGGQGRVFFDELVAVDSLHSLFDDAPRATHALAQLQHAVLTLQASDQAGFEADDTSLAIHACHGPMRQVETLKDALLARFAADASLQPADVVVLVPGMDDFAPYIDAVFGQIEQGNGPMIPYAIADRTAMATSPVLSAWLSLLALPDGNWEADTLATLLELPVLAQQFGLTDIPLDRLRAWLAAAGVRRAQSGDAFSWQAGIGRLILGVAMPAGQALSPHTNPVFAGLCPSEGLDLRFAPDVAGLAAFARQLGAWQTALAEPRSLPDWSSLLINWLDQWFVEDVVAFESLASLRKTLASLGDLASYAGRDAALVDRIAVLEWLTATLEAGSGAGGFLTGGVTFAQLMPMRNLPFRVVAVLGLDDGVFPRESQPDGFDLIAQYPRRGDRARALDERWLFLETLLAARDALLLFYTGRDARTDQTLPPSTVIADLLDALAIGWPSREPDQKSGDQFCWQHPLQPFSPRRFEASLPSFDGRWAAVAAKAGRGDAQPAALTRASLPATPVTSIALADLLRFARDPASWFLQKLGVRFERGGDELVTRELFALDASAERALLQLAGDQADNAAVLTAMGAGSARLPLGLAGDIWAAQTAEHVAPAVAAWRGMGDDTQSVHLAVGDYVLAGRLGGLGADGIGLRAWGKLRDGDRMVAWVQTLVLAVANLPGIAPVGCLYGLDQQATYTAPQFPADVLHDWLEAYTEAYRRPSGLITRTSLAYAVALHKGSTPDDALAAAAQAWQGSQQYAGEGSYANLRALWRGESPLDDERFAPLAEQLLLPLLNHEILARYAA